MSRDGLVKDCINNSIQWYCYSLIRGISQDPHQQLTIRAKEINAGLTFRNSSNIAENTLQILQLTSFNPNLFKLNFVIHHQAILKHITTIIHYIPTQVLIVNKFKTFNLPSLWPIIFHEVHNLIARIPLSESILLLSNIIRLQSC